MFKHIWFGFFIWFFISCASTDKQAEKPEASQELEEELSYEDYEDEEEEFLSSSEDEDSEELAQAEEDSAPKEELQEKEAEDELKEIEDEFAEFVEESEETAVAEEPSEETPQETQVAEEITEESSSEEISETPPEETAEIPVAEETTEELPAAEETTEELPVAEEAVEEIQEPVPTEEIAQQTALLQITDIRYQDRQIYIDTTGGVPSYRSRFNEATKQFVIEIPQAQIVDQLKWPYIMKEFDSGFALLQADQKTEDTVRIIVQMRPEASSPLMVQKSSNDGFIISSDAVNLSGETVADAGESSAETIEENNFSEPVESAPSGEYEGSSGEGSILHAKTIEEFLLGEHRFYGNPITLDVRGASLKDILYFLAEDSGINMIVSEDIPEQTKISIRLNEIPWDQALVLIMKKNKLGYIREGNVITISTLKEIREHQKEMEELIANQEKLTPLKMEIVPIAYAQADQIKSHIDLFKSDRGKIRTDKENNSLLIFDTEEAISDIKRLILDLDRTPKQVMISAKIVEVSEDFNRSFGVSWGLSGGTMKLHPAVAIGPLNDLVIESTPLLEMLPGAPDAGIAGGNFTVGTFSGGIGDLDIQLGFAETDGTARVLSSPRIMALNGQSATINQSTESISFSAIIPEGGGTQAQIQKSPITLNLSVTPQITNVDSIYMQVNVSRSSVGRVEEGPNGSRAEATSSRNATTRILIKSGQTAVIGGVYENRKTDNVTGLPFLKHIPVVSWLFSKNQQIDTKSELLLFLTPRIIDISKDKLEAV